MFDLEPRHLFGQAVLGRPSCMLCAAWQFVENLTMEETGAHFQFIHRVHATDRLGAELMCALCFFGMFVRKDQRSVQLFQAYRT